MPRVNFCLEHWLRIFCTKKKPLIYVIKLLTDVTMKSSSRIFNIHFEWNAKGEVLCKKCRLAKLIGLMTRSYFRYGALLNETKGGNGCLITALKHVQNPQASTRPSKHVRRVSRR